MKELSQTWVRQTIKKRPEISYKGDYGHVFIVAGHESMGGAALIASQACVYSGAGLVTLASDSSNKSSLYAHCPEAMFANMYDSTSILRQMAKADVILIGPGLGRGPKERDILKLVLQERKEEQALIIDADAIYLYAKDLTHLNIKNAIFTPHPGEWRYLSGLEIENQDEFTNRDRQLKLRSSVVLKKHRTELYFQDESLLNPLGTPAQATGGMGDCLAGMIAGFLAQFDNEEATIASAVYLHSFIAERLAQYQYVSLPSQIIQHIPLVMKEFEEAIDPIHL